MKLLAGLLSLMIVFPAFANKKAAGGKGNPACEAEAKKGSSKADEEVTLTPEQQEAAAIMNELLAAREKLYDRLRPATNPFFLAFTLEEAEATFNGLSKIQDPNAPSVRYIPSILGEVNNLLTTRELTTLNQVKPVLKKLFAYIGETLDNEYADNAMLYRGSVSVDLLLQALQPFFPAPQYKVEEDKTDEKQKKKDQEEDDEPEPGQEAPPEYPDDNDDDYDPHNKDTKKGRGKSKERVVVAEVNIPGVAYFKLKYFNTLKRNPPIGRKRLQVGPLEPWEKQLRDHGQSEYTLKLYPGTKTQFTALMPLGYEPRKLNPKYKGRLEALPSGKYLVTLNEPHDGPIEISLDKEENAGLNPMHVQFLKSKYGIEDDEWPLHIRSELFPKIKGKDMDTAARTIENYLRSEYKYRTGGGSESSVLEALSTEARSFQCDFAGEIMVAMMRDYMKMPCRVVGVFRGQRKSGDKENSYLSLPNDRHIMVECIDASGMAHYYDPTPKEKDENDDKQDKNNPFLDNSKFDDDEVDKAGQHEGEEDEDGEDGSGIEDNSAEHKKKIKADTEQSLKEKSGGNPSGGNNKGKTEKKDGKPEDKAETEANKVHENKHIDAEELVDNVSNLGNMSLKPPKKVAGVLENRARQLYMRRALDPRRDTVSSAQAMNLFEVDQAMDHQWRPRIKEAKIALEGRQRGIPETFIALAAGALTTDPVLTYKRLVQVEDRLHIFAKTQDNGERDTLLKILNKIREIKAIYQGLNQESEIAVAMASKFHNGLPPHARQLVNQKYKMKSVGANLETDAMLKDLENGKLRDYNVIRVLYPMTDFIMDSTPTPAYKMARTVLRDYRYVYGNEFLPLPDISQGFKALLLQPHKGVIQNMLEGTAFLPLRRQRTRVPDPGGQKQPKRVTVVGYDTSGSMDGEPGDFQAALLAAFTDRALSDRAPSGKHMHQCVLMGFDDDVHTTHVVLDSEAAYKVIQNYRQQLRNTQGGTNIMNVLRKALNAIIEAQGKLDEPLASANIILMSDGGSDVDINELRELIAKVDRRTPVKFMFIGINGTNAQLIELSKTIRQAGAAEALYTYFSTERIGELLKEGEKAPKADKKRELYTKKTGSDVPPQVQSMLTSLSHELDAEMLRLDRVQSPKDLAMWHHEMARTPVRQNSPDAENTDISLEFSRLRGLLARSKVLKDKYLVRSIADDALRNFPRTFGKTLNDIMVLERENVNHLLTASMAYAAGRGRN